MTVPTVAFFNNKGGVGKTTLVYHLSWMFDDLGVAVLAADLDPQANLSAAFLPDDRLEKLWPADATHRATLAGALSPLVRGVGDILAKPHVEEISERLGLIVGDLEVARTEDEFSIQWPKAGDGEERGFRVLSAFWRIVQRGVEQTGARIVLLDLGPNLGAINRAALIASDHLVIPLAPDLFSFQGWRNLGPTVAGWRDQWQERVGKNPDPTLCLPDGQIKPLGYVVLQHALRLDRPTKSYERWVTRIPQEYSQHVLGKRLRKKRGFDTDRNCLALMKHYRSLMPMAQEARKPVFHLRAADGALGAHHSAAQSAGADFGELARRIATAVGVTIPRRGSG